MPCLRHNSATFAPASASFRTAMICSSLNRFIFTSASPFQWRTLPQTRTISGEHVSEKLRSTDPKHAATAGISRHGREGISYPYGGPAAERRVSPAGGRPEQFREAIRREIEVWRKGSERGGC